MAGETTDSMNSSRDSSLEFSNDLEGFDNEFIPPEHEHECPICMMCLRDPYQTDCGHRFCKNCIKRWLRANGPGRKCPACNEILTTEQIYPDNFAKREVYTLQAKCTYSKKGCEEEDNLKAMLNHQIDCIYRPAVCNKCGQTFVHKDLDEHASKLCPKITIQCKTCHHQVQLSNFDNHKHRCGTATNSCPDCGESLDNLEENASPHVCNRETIKCRFYTFGCRYECSAIDMGTHMEQYQQEHLLGLAEAVDRLVRASGDDARPDSREIGQLQSLMLNQTALTELKPMLGSTAAAEDDDFKKPVLQRTRSLAFAGEKGTAGDNVGSVTFRSGEYAVENVHDVVLQLRNTVANQQQHIIELRSKVNTLENSVQETRSQMRDMKMDFKNRSCQGTFIWRLKNYTKLREDARRGAPNCVIHSPGFYTSFNGYQFCIRLNLNGVENAQGTHLSLFIHLMQSENDDILLWPFTGKVTLSICDQHQSASKRNPITETLLAKPGLAAFQKPTTFRNHKGFGYMEFAPLHYLEGEERCFIKDDTLLIKAEVRPNTAT